VDLTGTHAKKKFTARYYQGDRLRGILISAGTPKQVESAKTELKRALGK
jgi:hypothetical protein